MARSLAVRKVARPPRILLDLAEGKLGQDEVDAVRAWLLAGGLTEPPEQLLERALASARAGV